MKLKVKRLAPDAKLPYKKRDTDEGFDIHSNESLVLEANTTTKISTGIAAQCSSKNYWLQLEGRSGMAVKGIFPIGGIIDVGYNGEIGVMLCNLSGESYTINKHDRIAQLVIREHIHVAVEEVDDFEESERGSSGFGDSGR